MRAPKGISVTERFWSKVNISDKCWLWTASCFSDGYGRFVPQHGRSVPAHRFAWELTYGPIPAGLFVCHRCDVHGCVRPDHLFLGTQSDNMRDCVAKGRHFLQNPANHRRKLTEDQVREMRNLYIQGVAQFQLAKQYNISPSTVRQIVFGQTWTHLAYTPPLDDPNEVAAKKVAIGEAIRADRAKGMTIERLARKYHIATARVGPITRGELWK